MRLARLASVRHPRQRGIWGLAFVLSVTAARAQTPAESPPPEASTTETPPPVVTAPAAAEPLPEPVSVEEPPLPAASSADREAVFRALMVFADYQKRERFVGSAAGVVLGGTTIALGGVLAEETNTSAEPWYVLGGITVGASVLGLFLPSAAENLARSVNAAAPSHSAAEAAMAEQAWREHADRARGQRYFGAGFSFLLGVGSVVAGSAILSGAGGMSHDDELAWGTILIGGGAAMGVAGVAQLILPSSMEASYAAFAATQRKSPTLDVSLGGPGGLGVSALGRF